MSHTRPMSTFPPCRTVVGPKPTQRLACFPKVIIPAEERPFDTFCGHCFEFDASPAGRPPCGVRQEAARSAARFPLPPTKERFFVSGVFWIVEHGQLFANWLSGRNRDPCHFRGVFPSQSASIAFFFSQLDRGSRLPPLPFVPPYGFFPARLWFRSFLLFVLAHI